MTPSTSNTHFGYVALMGLPNAGKSTLLNQLLGTKVSIVTPKVQTTRRRVLGVFMQDDLQIAFLDTPGVFEPKTRLDKSMVNVALQAAKEADVVCVIIDACKPIEASDRLLLQAKESRTPVIVVLNKIDKVAKDKLILIADHVQKTHGINTIFMISALKNDGITTLITHITKYIPEGPWLFNEDDLTDLSTQDLATEFTREKLFFYLHQEIPYGLMVEHELWERNKETGKITIFQRIIINKQSHKGIVLGKGGENIKKVREAAQREISNLLQQKVTLKLQVVVKEDWKDKPQYYTSQGLEF